MWRGDYKFSFGSSSQLRLTGVSVREGTKTETSLGVKSFIIIAARPQLFSEEGKTFLGQMFGKFRVKQNVKFPSSLFFAELLL